MNCPKCNSPYVSFVTRQGKLINKAKRKRNRLIIGISSAVGFLSIGLHPIGTLPIIFAFIYWVGCKIKEKHLPNDHVEMICNHCGNIEYIED